MVEAVVASGEVETGCVGVAIVEGLPSGFVECLVAIAPLAVEPDRRFACVEMPEDLLVVALDYARAELFCDQVHCGLIDNLVLDAEK